MHVMGYLKKTILGLAGSAAIYTAGTATIHIALGFKGIFFSEKIHSQSQLEEVLAEEKEKLSIPADAPLSAFLKKGITEEYGGYSFLRKNNDGSYTIALDQYFGNSKEAVRHELWHYRNRDLDKSPSSLRYFFVDEMRASLCGVLDICI